MKGQDSAHAATHAVRWTDRAISDLEAIGDHIARDNPDAARRWVARLVGVAEAAAAFPEAGRRVPEVAREDVRERFLQTYRGVYRTSDSGIDILTIFEGHRRFPEAALPS